jgi:26S proteasome non-ATPase regulatory subunit 9
MGYTLPSETSPAEQARALMALKDHIEADIASQAEILSANSADMHTPLVDREGFPRADLDLWAVRTARVRIIELRNNLKDTMNKLGKALENVYERKPERTETASVQLIPFARVNSVVSGSPAADAVRGLGECSLL